jgi:hypothetical protein
MKRTILTLFVWTIASSLPAIAQDRLYPVRDGSDSAMIVTSDRSSFVVEKSFVHKLTIGWPNDDKTWFLPDTRTPLILLWLRIHNISQQSLAFDPGKFTSTDEEGKVYPALTPDDAFNRIFSGDTPIASKTLRGISLGRVGGKPTEEQFREDIERYSLQARSMPPGGVSEGLIYFEAPARKKFTVGVKLGDLWSKPFMFANSKPK